MRRLAGVLQATGGPIIWQPPVLASEDPLADNLGELGRVPGDMGLADTRGPSGGPPGPALPPYAAPPLGGQEGRPHLSTFNL